jgi:hypothetical protein
MGDGFEFVSIKRLKEDIMKRPQIYAILMSLFLTLLFSATAWAQDATEEATAEATASQGTNLTYNSPVTGTIDNVNFTQTWALQTASADRISIKVERTSGNLIPTVDILDPNNQVLQSSYGADETAAAALISNYTLPVGGTFQVQVGRDGGETGTTTGDYTVTVLPLATAVDNPNNTLVIDSIQYDTPVRGELSATQWVSLYTLDAPSSDMIQVYVERVTGTLMPEVDVRDANGSSIGYGYIDYSGTFAQTNTISLTAPGQYTIAVTRQSGFTGETVGGYEVTVKLLGAGEANPSLQGEAGTVEYDKPLTGTLTNARWYEDWQLTTQAGDTVTITVERPENVEDGVVGSLQPEVSLLGGSRQELRRGYLNYDGASSTIDRFQFDGPGSYTVRVVRRSDQGGVTSGAYVLTVHLVGSGKGSPDLTSVTGTIEKGTPVTGEITPARWADSWTYEATEGEAVDIKVTRTDGTLIPQLDIQDSNGQSVRSVYYEPSRDRALLTGYTFPGTGTYRIVVFRDRDQNGLTTGNYSLKIDTPGQ